MYVCVCVCWHCSLQKENQEFICGASLTELNLNISKTFPLFTGVFNSMNDYIVIIITGDGVCVC